jgi:transposase
VVLALAEGDDPRDVSRILGVALCTVYRARGLYLAEGLWGLCDGRRHRAPVKTTPDVLAVLQELLASDPRALGWNRTTWTCELLALALARRTGVSFHRSWVHVLIKQIRMRWGRPRPSVRRLNPRRWRQWRRLARELADVGPREVILFADEADIDLNPRIGFMWMPRGQQVEIPTPGKNQKAYLAGALNIGTGHVLALAGPRKNSVLFIELLRHVARAYRWATRIHLLVDQYKIHFSHATNRAVALFGGRIVLHRIPTYSPQLNAIERLWKKLHDAVTRNHRFSTMRQLLIAVRDFLQDARPFVTDNPLTLGRPV